MGDASPLVVRPGSEETPLLAQFEPQPEPRRSIGFSAPSAEQITGSQPTVSAFLGRRVLQSTGVSPAPRMPLGRTPRFGGTQYDLPRTASRRGGFFVAAVVIVVLAIAAGLVWKFGLFKSSHTVPNLVGQTTKQAATAITSGGYTLGIHDVNSTSPANEIVSQSPKAGTSAKSGTVINVNVSNGSGRRHPAAKVGWRDL